MKILDIIKNLMTGFWRYGFLSLCKVVSKHWIISIIIVALIAFLCSDSETSIYAWFLIGVFAVYCAIKAAIDIIIGIINYIKTSNVEDKAQILQITGGKIFDFILCVIGIFQVLRVFTHVAKVTKSTSSAINVIDDVSGVISRLLEYLKK